MTVYLVVSLPKLPYIHRIYIGLWPNLYAKQLSSRVQEQGDSLESSMATRDADDRPIAARRLTYCLEPTKFFLAIMALEADLPVVQDS
jgi:hypothetical protein